MPRLNVGMPGDWSLDPRDWARSGAEWVKRTVSDGELVIELPSMPKPPDRIVVSPGGAGTVGPRGKASGLLSMEYDVGPVAIVGAAALLWWLFSK